jgi:DNA-binding response OmpR family regulator
MPREPASLNTATVLIVEDEFLLATMLAEDLKAAGFATLGPVASLANGMRAVAEESFSLAVLDVNLAGQMVYPLADELAARHIPFLFLTGYGASHLPDRFRNAPRLSKPYDPALLTSEIAKILSPVRR